ncbi:uracil-DNA glycosylase [bacterium]|nr:MAG: uracil-DNA glycosylase [bacterium]
MGEEQIVLDLGLVTEAEPENIGFPQQKETSGDSRLDDAVSANTLVELEEAIIRDGGCERCGLAEKRNKIVVGQGDPNASIVFIGEGPGGDEDRIGLPFVGRAGKLLDRILKAMGLSRERGVYICNIVKCRPPGNRDPLPEEAEACIPYLLRQLELIKPDVICCLGRVAAQNLLGTNAPLRKLRGKTHIFKGIPVLVTYHPAYLLRNPAGKPPTWEDMKELLRIAGLPIPEKYNK